MAQLRKRSKNALAPSIAVADHLAARVGSCRTENWRAFIWMSALGQKPTFAVHQPKSALPPKADIRPYEWTVR
jgi:uncharacterized protein YfaQ (DUF2300 family)